MKIIYPFQTHTDKLKGLPFVPVLNFLCPIPTPEGILTFCHGELCYVVPDALTYYFHQLAACLWVISTTWNWMMKMPQYLRHWMSDCSPLRCYLCFLKTETRKGSIWGRKWGSRVACWRSCVVFLEGEKRREHISDHLEHGNNFQAI